MGLRGPRQHRINAEVEQQIVDAIENGAGRTQAVRDTGVSYTTFRLRLKSSKAFAGKIILAERIRDEKVDQMLHEKAVDGDVSAANVLLRHRVDLAKLKVKAKDGGKPSVVITSETLALAGVELDAWRRQQMVRLRENEERSRRMAAEMGPQTND